MGNVDEAGVDLLSIIKEHGLSHEFSKEVINEAKKVSKFDKNEIPKRVDLRDLQMFTIDGEDAKDLDDAVYVEKLEDGNYKFKTCDVGIRYNNITNKINYTNATIGANNQTLYFSTRTGGIQYLPEKKLPEKQAI